MGSTSRTHRALALSAIAVAAIAWSASPAVYAQSGASPDASPAASAEAPSAAASQAASPASSLAAGATKFTVAFTSPGLSSAPFLAAIADLNSQGYEIDTPVVTASELVTEGVASGQFAFGSAANNATLTAIEKGANIRLIVNRVANEWTLYAANSITDCAGLNGKRLAIHSEGAVSTAMVRKYISEVCPGTEPAYVVIEGSPNRVQALLANAIDASPLELVDAVTIDSEASDRYHLLTSLATDVPDLQPQSVFVNGEFAQSNPDVVVALIKAILKQHAAIDGNPEYLKQIAEQYVADAINADTIDDAVQKYVDLKMFQTDGGLTDENLAFTAEFFGPAPAGTGSTTRVLDVAEFADLSYLEQARANP